MPSVSELFIYPLKSASGIKLQSVEYTQRGPIKDRHWMVVDKNNRFVTQRHHPKMCLIGTQIIDHQLTIVAPGQIALTVAFNRSEVRQVQIWEDYVDALDCGDDAAKWVSDYLQLDCRLVCMPETTTRLVDTHYAHQNETVSFADGFPTLVVSQASLDDFNSKITQAISMDRFRPNIVIAGCEPYEEDSWQSIKIGEITFNLVKPCSRCIIPSIDQASANKQHEVTKALNTYRRRERATYFGQNALHNTVGHINVGDSVEILS